MGKADCLHDTVSRLPLLDGIYMQRAVNRALRLTCLTNAYADLWCDVATPAVCDEVWTAAGKIGRGVDIAWSASTLTNGYGKRQSAPTFRAGNACRNRCPRIVVAWNVNRGTRNNLQGAVAGTPTE